jgi:hypothetical protein
MGLCAYRYQNREFSMASRCRGALVVLVIASTVLSIDAGLLAPGSSAASTSLANPEALGFKPIEPTANKDTVLPYGTAKERLDPDAVRYYVNTFDVSEEVASERLAIQTMVPNLTTQLTEALGADFGALWFDNANGQWVIDARSGGVGSAIRLMSNVGLAGHYRIVTVPWNAYELETLRSDLEVELGHASVGIAGDHISVHTRQTPTSSERETITQSRQAFAVAEGITEAPAVETEQLSGNIVPNHGSVSCGKYGFDDIAAGGYCNTLLAGDHWYTAIGTTHYNCTLAWWVSIKEREPKEFPSILTAGHCIAPVGTVAEAKACEPEATSCNEFGLTLTYYRGEGRGDAGLIDYYSGLYGNPTFPLAAGYWNWWDSGFSPLEYYRLTPPSRGTAICLQGYRTGSSCGTVKNPDVPVEVEGLTDSNMIEVELTSGTDCKGDSGGPWDMASEDTAVGINDAGKDEEDDDECGKIDWLTPVEEPVDIWGLTVWGGSSWHEPW